MTCLPSKITKKRLAIFTIIVRSDADNAIALQRLMRLVNVRVSLGRLGQTVVDLGA